MKKIFLIDAVNFLFRSYYAIAPMTRSDGKSTHALFGFIRSLLKLLTDFSPDYVVAVFDGPNNKKLRSALYEGYKSNRTSMPEDLLPQLAQAMEFCALFGIPSLCIEGVEADDTIASIASWTDALEIDTYICTSDKDLAQLVSPKTFLVHAHKNNAIIDEAAVISLFNVKPSQIRDYLALIGDTSDNIPGVAGIGPKTASALLQEHGSLEEILKIAPSLTGRKKDLLLEGTEKALLSQKLAQLHTFVEVPNDLSFYKQKEKQGVSLSQFYKENGFLSLLGEETKEPAPKKTTYTLISSEEELATLLVLLEKQTSICIDTETTSIHPMEAELVGIGLGFEEGKAWYIPINHTLSKQSIFAFLQTLFTNPSIRFFGHNLKYDLHILFSASLPAPAIDFDTMIASYLLTPHILKHNLDDLCLKYFSFVKTSIDSLIGKGKNQITIDKVPIEKVKEYCCEDVDYTIRLKNIFLKELQKENLLLVLETIELPLLHILLDMERNGIFLDLPAITQVSHELSSSLVGLEEKIYALAGEKFNINSPKQLSQILFEKMGLTPPKKTKTGVSTSAEVLESLQNKSPLIPLLLEYRQIGKLLSTYADSLQKQINHKTGRIHCTFNQSVAATGRLSCQSPNLQNIPVKSVEGRKIRSSFTPQNKEWSYLSADYSQIELRLLAHLSDDPMLLSAFNSGEDIHAYTASVVFGVPLTEVTKEMRRKAKAVNFGILYGQQAFGLAGGLSISYAEASAFIDTYFSRYPKVKQYIEECKETVRKTGFSTTLTGRKRPIPEITSKNPALRAFAERLAVNTPLQGTAADLIKLAMISINKKWKLKKSLLILQIHDELLFEVPPEEIDDLSYFVKKEMEGVFSLKVPLSVDISIGKNWGEC